MRTFTISRIRASLATVALVLLISAASELPQPASAQFAVFDASAYANAIQSDHEDNAHHAAAS